MPRRPGTCKHRAHAPSSPSCEMPPTLCRPLIELHCLKVGIVMNCASRRRDVFHGWRFFFPPKKKRASSMPPPSFSCSCGLQPCVLSGLRPPWFPRLGLQGPLHGSSLSRFLMRAGPEGTNVLFSLHRQQKYGAPPGRFIEINFTSPHLFWGFFHFMCYCFECFLSLLYCLSCFLFFLSICRSIDLSICLSYIFLFIFGGRFLCAMFCCQLWPPVSACNASCAVYIM